MSDESKTVHLPNKIKLTCSSDGGYQWVLTTPYETHTTSRLQILADRVEGMQKQILALVAERDEFKARAQDYRNAWRTIMYRRSETVLTEDSKTQSDTPDQTQVDIVIDQLDKRLVSQPQRTKLRGALDKADAPLGGRAGADQAVGRAIR